MDISVIVPFYKGNQYMKQLFGVVRRNAETAPTLQIELILVNDSPQCPVEYDLEWVQGFTLRVLQNGKNLGIHGSRVRGIREAAGKYIQMLDQDDLLTDNALSSQMAAIADCDVVVANGEDQGGANPGPLYLCHGHQQWAVRERFYYSVSNMIASPGQCLLRKETIPRYWLEHVMQKNGSDDLLLWLLYFQQDTKWTVNPEKLYTHVITGENVSADKEKMLASSMEVLALLEKTGKLTARQRRKFRRSRGLGKALADKRKLTKWLTMLCYPDVLWEKFCLRCYKL